MANSEDVQDALPRTRDDQDKNLGEDDQNNQDGNPNQDGAPIEPIATIAPIVPMVDVFVPIQNTSIQNNHQVNPAHSLLIYHHLSLRCNLHHNRQLVLYPNQHHNHHRSLLT
jgi:hypothetical protein